MHSHINQFNSARPSQGNFNTYISRHLKGLSLLETLLEIKIYNYSLIILQVKSLENGGDGSGKGLDYFEGGKVTKENMTEFMKQIKKANADLTDEEAAQIAASKIADSKPKSRMYYKIGASREMAGGKKVDPKANMSDKLKVMMMFIIIMMIITYDLYTMRNNIIYIIIIKYTFFSP